MAVSNNLPPGVKPHDSDPEEQKPLAGRMTATLEIEVSCRIHSNGARQLWRTDECYTRKHLDKLIRKAVAAALDTHDRLTLVEAEVTGSSFEPD